MNTPAADACRVTNEQQVLLRAGAAGPQPEPASHGGFAPEANLRGMMIDTLADKIIAERLDLEQKVCRVNEIQVRTLAAIDSAVGDHFEEAARQAFPDIECVMKAERADH